MSEDEKHERLKERAADFVRRLNEVRNDFDMVRSYTDRIQIAYSVSCASRFWSSFSLWLVHLPS
jgi:hypothetical protein